MQNPFITDEVRVAVVPKFPPRTINELLFSDIIWANRDTLPADPRPWEIYLPPGSYDIVAVIWKANNQSWNISDIIGVYGGTLIGDQLIPPFPFRPIVVEENSVIDTLHIVANLDRVNRDTLIQGRVQFLGPWPPNTGVVGIGAFWIIFLKMWRWITVFRLLFRAISIVSAYVPPSTFVMWPCCG